MDISFQTIDGHGPGHMVQAHPISSVTHLLLVAGVVWVDLSRMSLANIDREKSDLVTKIVVQVIEARPGPPGHGSGDRSKLNEDGFLSAKIA